VLGDTYPKTEIDDLTSWYHGALHYRGTIEHGDFWPRWRTPLAALDHALDTR
jgi:hypothetical protein